MKRPRRSFRESVAMFLSGRNGVDSLGRAVMILGCVLAVVNLFLRSLVLALLSDAVLVYVVFRMMSRNLVARRAENARWWNFCKRIKDFFRLQKNKRRDRKTHVYHKCPHCKKTLRLPRVKGMHTVCCPCCHERFEMRVK
ncbi:MAG: hypothetical protein IKJ35_01505 [Clostridia bacterium]|nr:hypothetical protein [Clostridia bacterium]